MVVVSRKLVYFVDVDWPERTFGRLEAATIPPVSKFHASALLSEPFPGALEAHFDAPHILGVEGAIAASKITTEPAVQEASNAVQATNRRS